MWPFKKPEEHEQLDLTLVDIHRFSSKLVLNRFDSGATPIDRFLRNKANSCEKRLEYRTFIATYDNSPNCIGYYTLQLGSDSVPEVFKKGRKDYIKNYTAFPAVNLSFLGVHKPYQRKGLGRFLLQDAFVKAAAISEHCGFYAFTLQSYDAESTAFYRKIGFEEYSEGGGQPKMLYPLRNILKLVKGEE